MRTKLSNLKKSSIAWLVVLAMVGADILSVPFRTDAADASAATYEDCEAATNWSAQNVTISSDGTYYHSGNKSLKIVKNKLTESLESGSSLVTGQTKYAINKPADLAGDFALTWDVWYRSQDSNNMMRVDAVIYNASGTEIDTLSGNIVMLSRRDALSEWTKISTTETVPAEAAQVSYKIYIYGNDNISNGDKATVYVDDISCAVTETYTEKIVDSSDFHAVTETGEVAGWTAANGTLSVEGGAGKFVGNSADGRMIYETEKLIPGYRYKIVGKYTATTDITAEVLYYNADGQMVDSTSKNLAASATQTSFSLEVMAADAVTAKICIGGSGTITLDDLYVYETRTRTNAESGWTGEMLWYPEDAATDAVNQSRYFRTTVTLSKARKASYVRIACDDSFGDVVLCNNSLDPNGTNGWQLVPVQEDGRRGSYAANVQGILQWGFSPIVLAAEIKNASSGAGYTMELEVLYEDGTSEIITANRDNTKVSATKPANDWYTIEYDDSDSAVWKTPKSLGVLPYCTNLEDADFAFPYAYAVNRVNLTTAGTPTENATGGAEKTTSVAYMAIEQETQLKATYTARLYDSSNTLVAHVPTTATLNTGSVDFTYTIPDYLASGTYTMKIHEIGINGNTDSDGSPLCTLNVTQPSVTLPVSKVVVDAESKVPHLQINGEKVAPTMYLEPSQTTNRYNYDTMSSVENSGITLYGTYSGSLSGLEDGNYVESAQIWKSSGVDTGVLDKGIYKVLDLNPNAMVIVNLAMDAPQWWLDANPTQKIKDANGTQYNYVSYASTSYRAAAADVITQLVNHMATAPYRGRVAGVRLTGGRTYEWMQQNIQNGSVLSIDYSDPMKTAFGGTIPSVTDRAGGETDWLGSLLGEEVSILLNAQDNANVIKYNALLSQCITDSVLAYATAVKDANSNLIVGAYNGYLWYEVSSEAIGGAHTTVDQILNSDKIDFISSPANYGERLGGYSTGYMALSDSVAAHGKLYMVEQDNRTVYGYRYGNAENDNPVGRANTLKESVDQITRDLTTDLVEGNGYWLFDMFGGWFDDVEILNRVYKIQAEYEASLNLNTGSNSQVAVFVGANNYDYVANDALGGDSSRSRRMLSSLYTAQRLELSKIGTSYDTYEVGDLTDSNLNVNWAQYKLCIFLSPFEVKSEERTAIENKLKKDGKYILWVYLPGVSTGSGANSASNITNLTDMTVEYTSSGYKDWTMASTFTDSAYGTGSFGVTTKYNTPYATITDGSATQIATYYGQNSKKSVAVKNIADKNYTSVYSAVSAVPASMLKKLCTDAGVHMYSTDADTVIHTNKSYINVYSGTDSNQTITLPASTSVYDVLNDQWIAEDVTEFAVSLDAGETGLYRIGKKASEPEEDKPYEPESWINPPADAITANTEYQVNNGIANWRFEETERVSNFRGQKAPKGWNIEYGEDCEFDNTNPVDAHSLKLDYSNASIIGESAWFGYWQTVKVEPGTYYKFSYWAKKNETARGSNNVTSAVIAETGNHETRLLTLDANNSNPDWAKYEGAFYSGNRSTVDIILYSYDVDGDYEGSVVWLDYLELKESTAADDNVVTNGDFETWVNNGTMDVPLYYNLWSNGNSITKETEGNNTFATYGPEAGINDVVYNLALEKNTSYTMTFRYKASRTGVTVQPALRDISNGEQFAFQEYITVQQANKWYTESVTFNTGSLNPHLLLRFYYHDGSAFVTSGYTCSFDDVVITKNVETSENLLDNGNFETWINNGSDLVAQNWNCWAGSTTSQKTTGRTGVGMSGTYTSESTTPALMVHAAPNLEVGKTYELSFWAKCDHTWAEGGAHMTARITGTGNIESNSRAEFFPTEADKWQKTTKYFTVGSGDSSANVYLEFCKREAGAAVASDYKFSYDDVRIVEHICSNFSYVRNVDGTHTATCADCGKVTEEVACNHANEHVLQTLSGAVMGITNSFCDICGGYISKTSFALGDVNGSQDVNSADLVRMKKRLGGIKASWAVGTGDLNNDTLIDMHDLYNLKLVLTLKDN